jgi:hypothetical protein
MFGVGLPRRLGGPEAQGRGGESQRIVEHKEIYKPKQEERRAPMLCHSTVVVILLWPVVFQKTMSQFHSVISIQEPMNWRSKPRYAPPLFLVSAMMMMMMMISGISVIKVIARFSFQPRYYIHDYPLKTYDYLTLFTCCLASLHLLIIALYLFIISLNLFIIALYRRHGRRHRLTYVCHIIYMHTFVYIIMYIYH